jgi:hypothetical protein
VRLGGQDGDDLRPGLAGQAAAPALGVQHPVDRGQQRRGDPLLRVLDAGLGRYGVAQRPLALLQQLQAAAGQHGAGLDHRGELRAGQAHGHKPWITRGAADREAAWDRLAPAAPRSAAWSRSSA